MKVQQFEVAAEPVAIHLRTPDGGGEAIVQFVLGPKGQIEIDVSSGGHADWRVRVEGDVVAGGEEFDGYES